MARNGHKTMAQLLMIKRADVNAKDVSGLILLYQAADNSHEALVRLLLEMESLFTARMTCGEKLD